jgi:hypothetical protein
MAHVAHDTASAVIAAQVDYYEAAVRFLTEMQWLLARASAREPARSLGIAWADVVRDTTAIQLSATRWWVES